MLELIDDDQPYQVAEHIPGILKTRLIQRILQIEIVLARQVESPGKRGLPTWPSMIWFSQNRLETFGFVDVLHFCWLDLWVLLVQLPPLMKLLNPPLTRLTFLLTGMVILNSCQLGGPERSGYMAGVGGPAAQVSGGPTIRAPAIPDDIRTGMASGTGSPLIEINRSSRRRFLQGRRVGRRIEDFKRQRGHATPPGKYKIIESTRTTNRRYGCFKDKATGKMLNDNVDIRVDKIPPGAVYYPAPMTNFMRITGGVGMHTGYLPGYAASHGCIRMPPQMSEKFFENARSEPR